MLYFANIINEHICNFFKLEYNLLVHILNLTPFNYYLKT